MTPKELSEKARQLVAEGAVLLDVRTPEEFRQGHPEPARNIPVQESYQAHIAGWGVVADVRKYIYEHMQRLSLRFYEDKQVGQLMSNVVNDTDLFEQLIAHAMPDVVVNVITFIAVTIVLMSLNWQLTLLSIIPIPLVILSLRVYARYVRPAFRRRQKELGDLNAMLNDNLSGIPRDQSIYP